MMPPMIFYVCIDCGVQSPPIWDSSNAGEVLTRMGWKVMDESKLPRVVCPECQRK